VKGKPVVYLKGSKLKRIRNSKAGRKFIIAATAFVALAVPATANAHTGYWKTMDSDIDRGPGFAITHVEADTYTGYFNQGKLLTNGKWRVKTHGLAGTTVNVTAHLNCYWWEYRYNGYGNPIKPADGHKWNVYAKATWSFRASRYTNIRNIRPEYGPGYSGWNSGPYDGCEISATAYSRDSGPVSLTIQKWHR
jgi:hypothetical protein